MNMLPGGTSVKANQMEPSNHKKGTDYQGKSMWDKKRQMKEHYIYQEMASTEGARESPSTLSLELD